MATLIVAKNTAVEEHRHLNGHHAGLLGAIVQPVASLYDQFSGPPMTERERQARDVAETRFDIYTGFAGY